MAPRPADGPTAPEATEVALRAMVGDEQRRAAAARRRRTASLEQQAMECTSLADVLRSCCAAGEAVELEAVGLGPFRGRIAAVGPDAALLDDGHRRALVRIDAVASVRSPSARSAPPGRGAGATGALDRFDEIVRAEAAERSAVELWTGSPVPERGRLRGVGSDVVLLEASTSEGPRDGADHRSAAVTVTVAVALGAVRAVRFGTAAAHSSSAPPLSAEPTTSG